MTDGAPERLAECRVAGLAGTPPNGEAGMVELLEWRIAESFTVEQMRVECEAGS